MLDKGTSRVTPLLVKLYDSHQLYALAKDKREPARMELASVVLDLFQNDLTVRESELITDVLSSLIRQAERDLRRALAEKLATNANVPLRIVLQLANDEIDVAEPMLMHSPVLNELDLTYIIQARGPEYWRAVARRCELSEHVIDVLADTREQGTALSLLANERVTVTTYALEVFGDMAADSEEIASVLVDCSSLPQDIAARLYRCVGDGLKERITARFPEVETEVGQAVDAVVHELSDISRSRYLPDGRLIQAALAAERSGFLAMPLMISTLHQGKIAAFIAQFSCYADLPVEMVLDILRQPHGQGLAVACKGIGIEKADFLAFYLLTQRVRKASRIADKRDISRALAYYERVRPEVAERILRNSRNSSN